MEYFTHLFSGKDRIMVNVFNNLYGRYRDPKIKLIAESIHRYAKNLNWYNFLKAEFDIYIEIEQMIYTIEISSRYYHTKSAIEKHLIESIFNDGCFDEFIKHKFYRLGDSFLFGQYEER